MELMKQGHQHIEQRDHRGQTGLNEGFQSMKHPLETTDDRQQRERGFYRHAVVPGAPGTPFAVLRHAILATKAVIGQNNAASTELLDERMELVIRDIHRVPVPIDDLPKAIENPTQLDADAPAPFIFGLFAKLLGAATLPNWTTTNPKFFMRARDAFCHLFNSNLHLAKIAVLRFSVSHKPF